MSTTVVIDASALVELLLQTKKATNVEAAIADREMFAPSLIDIEVLSVLRRLVLQGRITGARGDAAVSDLRSAPIQRTQMETLIPDAWKLKDRLTAYDAVYVALAIDLDTQLITTDERLGRSGVDKRIHVST